jgi:hypothetical protein
MQAAGGTGRGVERGFGARKTARHPLRAYAVTVAEPAEGDRKEAANGDATGRHSGSRSPTPLQPQSGSAGMPAWPVRIAVCGS